MSAGALSSDKEIKTSECGLWSWLPICDQVNFRWRSFYRDELKLDRDVLAQVDAEDELQHFEDAYNFERTYFFISCSYFQ